MDMLTCDVSVQPDGHVFCYVCVGTHIHVYIHCNLMADVCVYLMGVVDSKW